MGATGTAILPELVDIPGGSFVMGLAPVRADEGPEHLVRLAPFRAAVAPVTNAEYDRFVVATGAGAAPFRHEERFADPEQPVVGISWFDATAYCAWLARTTGLPARLPTEAERELASLGGVAGEGWPWAGPLPDGHPLYGELRGLDRPHVPRPECANGYGLRCMAENVHEWCSDWYDAAYYAVSPEEDPAGPAMGKRRVSRGGSWRHSVKFTRPRARASLAPGFRYNDFGFRIYADT